MSEKVHFLQFCGDLSKKSKFVRLIYINACERYRYALSEHGIVYYGMTYFFRHIRVWSGRAFLNFCWVSIFFYISIINISLTVAQTRINHTIFWNKVMRTFRCVYVNYFNRLRFFAEINTKLQKMHFFRQFKDHVSQEWNMETLQMIPFFSSTFSALTVFIIYFGV